MAEEKVFFFSDQLELEGLIDWAPGDKAAVITHPHSLYGGSMDNEVVGAITQVYRQQGYTTLRFNFRGVGRSQGEYGGGRGELRDLKIALGYLIGRGKTRIDLAGYSFGAWVNALLSPDEDLVKRMIMVSPPVDFLDFSSVQRIPPLQLVITGSYDEFAPPARIKTLLSRWNPTALLEVISGADHFYEGYTFPLKALITTFLKVESG
jgi:alpha/beta superfamily hydrolase